MTINKKETAAQIWAEPPMLDFPPYLIQELKLEEFLELLNAQLSILKEKIEKSRADEKGRREAHHKQVMMEQQKFQEQRRKRAEEINLKR